VTHLDNSARAQTAFSGSGLLKRFKERTGYGMLSNTSLNLKGSGLINRMSDLIEYASAPKLDGFVVGDRLYWFSAHPGVSV
jgi:predicted NodU family carbamoyl transferase